MSSAYLVRILFLLIILIIGFGFYWFCVKMIKMDRKAAAECLFEIKKPKNKNKRLYQAYKFFDRNRLTNKFLQKLVKIYSVRMPGDFRGVREKAVTIAMIMWGISLILILGSIIMGASLYGLSCAFLLGYVSNKTIVVAQMESYDLRIIKELNLFVDDVRHYYFDSKMIDESIKEAMNNSKNELIKQHAQKIYEVIIADNLIEAAKKYNLSAGDYFLKKFMASSVTIEQYGDRTIDGESLYLMSLRDLKQDIQIELMKRKNISAKFKGLSIISVIPYFALDYVKSFGMNSFASLHDIYQGTYGSIVAALLFILTLVMYSVVNILRDSPKVTDENPTMLKTLYKTRLVHRTVNNLLNRNWGKALKLRTLLKKTGNSLHIYLFTTKRLLYFCIGFIATVIFMFGVRENNKKMYYDNIITAVDASSGASDTELFEMAILSQHYLKQYKDTDIRRLYNSVSGLPATMSFDTDVQTYLQQQIHNRLINEAANISDEDAFNMIDPFLEQFEGTNLAIKQLAGLSYSQAVNSDDPIVKSSMMTFDKMVSTAKRANCFEKNSALLEKVAKGVASRIRKAQNQYFKWYDLLLASIAALIAYNAPIIIILLEKKSLQMDMMDEVIQFESVILILMQIERMTVEEILDWMHMFSRIFRTSLQSCICHFPLDDEDALDQLIEDEPYEPFRRLIENLKVCDRVGVTAAFNGLQGERRNYQEDRKLDNEISIAAKAAAGNFLAFLPFYGVIFGYMVIPYMIAAVGDFMSAMNQINEINAG